MSNDKPFNVALRDTMGIEDDGKCIFMYRILMVLISSADTFGPDRNRRVHYYPQTGNQSKEQRRNNAHHSYRCFFNMFLGN